MTDNDVFPDRTRRWRRRSVWFVQFLLSMAIIGYLVIQAERSGVFAQLATREKHWGRLVVGGLVVATGIFGTFFRWYRLLRSQRLEVSWRATLRFSAVGYIVNLAPLGIVGGDLLKAVLIARHQRQQQAMAITTVLIDRVIGLAALFYVITFFAFLTHSVRLPIPIDEICQFWAQRQSGSLETIPGEILFQFLIWVAILLTLLGTIAMALVLWPNWTGGRYLLRWLARLPKIGPQLDAMLRSFEAFGRTPLILLESILLAMVFHCLFGFGAWCMASGLFTEIHATPVFILLFSLSNSSQVIPLPLGPTEFVLNLLCQWVPIVSSGTLAMKAGEGAIIAITYRAANIFTAVAMIPWWFLSRHEVRELSRRGPSDQRERISPTAR